MRSDDSGSEDFDEEFADETFRLRGLRGDSLESERQQDDDDDEQAIRHGGRRGSVKEKPNADDPMELISRVVPETDDPTLPVMTIRVFIIGTFFCVLGAGISQVSSPACFP